MSRGSAQLTEVRKEEIFLVLLGREYDAWVSEIREIMVRKTA